MRKPTAKKVCWKNVNTFCPSIAHVRLVEPITMPSTQERESALFALVCLVDTPFQRAHNVADSPDLATRDFLTYGEDANPDWVRLYARDSNREVYDWLDALGVGWSGLFPLLPGNSVQRQHLAKERGVGLISPIYRECLRWTNIHFVWNTKVTSLLIEDGQLRGVRGAGLRNGMTNDFRSRSVVRGKITSSKHRERSSRKFSRHGTHRSRIAPCLA